MSIYNCSCDLCLNLYIIIICCYRNLVSTVATAIHGSLSRYQSTLRYLVPWLRCHFLPAGCTHVGGEVAWCGACRQTTARPRCVGCTQCKGTWPVAVVLTQNFCPMPRAQEQAGRVRSMELEILLASTQGLSILRTPPETCQSICGRTS